MAKGEFSEPTSTLRKELVQEASRKEETENYFFKFKGNLGKRT